MRALLGVSLALGGLLGSALPGVASSPRAAEPVTVNCYLTSGGTACYRPGAAGEASAAAAQAAYRPDLPLPYEVRQLGTPPTSAVPPSTECFTLVGGTACYPVDSPEAERAAEKEAGYLTPTSLPPASSSAPPLAPAVRVSLPPPSSVPAPAPPVTVTASATAVPPVTTVTHRPLTVTLPETR